MATASSQSLLESLHLVNFASPGILSSASLFVLSIKSFSASCSMELNAF